MAPFHSYFLSVLSLINPLKAQNCNGSTFPFSYGATDGDTVFNQVTFNGETDQYIGVGYTESQILMDGNLFGINSRVAIEVMLDYGVET